MLIHWFANLLRFSVIMLAGKNKNQETEFQTSFKSCTLHCTKMKFFIKDFFSKSDRIRGKLRIWSHLLKKSLMENFIFCVVTTLIFVANIWYPVMFEKLVAIVLVNKEKRLFFLFMYFSQVQSCFTREQRSWEGYLLSITTTVI